MNSGEVFDRDYATKDRRWFLPDIPEGMQIFESDVSPAGAFFKNPDVAVFAKAKCPSLGLQRDPSNKYDPNAIKIIGYAKGFFGRRKYELGFLPKEIARRIVQGGFWGQVQTRLRALRYGEYKEVRFEILGPKGRLKGYRKA